MPRKRYRALFFGTPDFAVPILDKLNSLKFIDLLGVFTQPDKPVGRQQTLTPPEVKTAAEKLRVPVYQPAKIQSEQFVAELSTLKLDVILVVAYGKIIPKKLLPIPKYGWLNVHASLLPKYRGAAPIQASILNGDKETGVTLMKIDEGLDTGPIIAKKKVIIEEQENFTTLHDKLSQLGAAIISESLLPYLEGKIKVQAQDNSVATETKIIKKEDGLIDWTKPADHIERQIRAYTPWPGAYTNWNGKRLLIHQTAIADENIALAPGTTKRLGNTILVGTGSSVLELKNLQLEGKKKQSAENFLKGYPRFSQTELSK